MPTITVNKKALYDYEILEKFEAGIVLSGQEVKSVKSGHINLKGSYISLHKGEIFLKNCHISPYKYAGLLPNYDPTQERKLLIKKSEIQRLSGKTQQKGLTIVPIKVYTKQRIIKLEFALVKGKKKVDKRESIKKRDTDREIRRQLKNN